jgi:amidase
MSELAFSSASQLSRKLQARQVSSTELTSLYIERIERLDGPVNAVVVRDFDRALDAARAADHALARGEPGGPLHGVPMTIKESYNITGLPTTFGVPAQAKNIAAADADVVKRYKRAGAHFLGKTNVPISLADLQSYNEIYGTTSNPWNLACTPGGSSGGSAASLAAGFCGLDSGSDIGGSIRNPAHYCGVYGHKPTWGVVSAHGHWLPGVHTANDLSVVGPMARSAEDLALAMDIIAGPPDIDAGGWTLSLPRPQRASLADYRVAVWADDPRAPVDAPVVERMSDVVDALVKAGAQVSDNARPAMDVVEAIENYKLLLHAAMSRRATPEMIANRIAAAPKLDAADRSDRALTILGGSLRHRDWLQLNDERMRLRRIWREFFQEWDVLLCPQTATTAFPHDHGAMNKRTISVNGATQPYLQQLFWAGLITGPYLPSTVFPTGPASDGLPIGLQAVSAEYNDYVCIDFCTLLAREIGGFVCPPGFD